MTKSARNCGFGHIYSKILNGKLYFLYSDRLNCLHCFRTENKLRSHEEVCKNKDFCGIAMSSEKNNTLDFNQYIESDKMSYMIYANVESLINKIDGCANNPEYR